MQLHYYVPFKAAEGVSAEYALKEKLINIEGVAIDTSVNGNKWQVPEEDLDYFTESLKGAQLRADHAESVFMVVGKVPEAQRHLQEVHFRAEVGEEKLIEKILRGYVTHVSVQVDSEDVECSVLLGKRACLFTCVLEPGKLSTSQRSASSVSLLRQLTRTPSLNLLDLQPP
jgi:hypothetical protein